MHNASGFSRHFKSSMICISPIVGKAQLLYHKDRCTLNFILEILKLGLNKLTLHLLRSLLTALGIIIGISAVIVMVAIGNGMKDKAIAQIKLLGVRNIIVRSVPPQVSDSANAGKKKLLSYGIEQLDRRRIAETVKGISQIAQLKRVGSNVQYKAKASNKAQVYGVSHQLKDATSIHIAQGRYLTLEDNQSLANVAVIGAQVAEKLFALENPIGKIISVQDRSNSQLFKVIGVIKPIGLAGGAGAALVGRDLNYDIHIPLSTAKSRFGDQSSSRSGGSIAEKVQLTELYITVDKTENVMPVSENIRQLMDMGHQLKKDIQIIVPQELIAQEIQKRKMFNILMVVVAGASLLVGGIGIMNIMLASVTERIREIGIRRALGARRLDIILQFLIETTLLSILGGLIGLVLGVGTVWIIAWYGIAQDTIGVPKVQETSVWVSLLAATSVGIIFGVYPAIKAAYQDPITALRHD